MGEAASAAGLIQKDVTMRILFWLLFLVSAHEASAAEHPRNIQLLLNYCKMPPSEWQRNFCVAYVAGVADTLTGIGAVPELFKDSAGIGICPDPIPTYGAITQVFVNWAEKHPEQWSGEMSLGVVSALREQWRCKQ